MDGTRRLYVIDNEKQQVIIFGLDGGTLVLEATLDFDEFFDCNLGKLNTCETCACARAHSIFLFV